MDKGLGVGWVGGQFEKGRGIGVADDEGDVPGLVTWANDGGAWRAAPDHFATDSLEQRGAEFAVALEGFQAGDGGGVWVAGDGVEADEVEHGEGGVAREGFLVGELGGGGFYVHDWGSLFWGIRVGLEGLTLLRRKTPPLALIAAVPRGINADIACCGFGSVRNFVSLSV